VSFSITLVATPAQALEIVDAIVMSILSFMNIANATTANLNDYADLITFNNIKAGSVVISGTSTPPNPTAGNVASTGNSINAGLSSAGAINGFPISSVSTVTVGSN